MHIVRWGVNEEKWSHFSFHIFQNWEEEAGLFQGTVSLMQIGISPENPPEILQRTQEEYSEQHNVKQPNHPDFYKASGMTTDP